MSALELEVFHSFDDVPVEDGAPTEDGDDAELRFARWANPTAPPLTRSLPAAIAEVRTSNTEPKLSARRVVPYRGPLKLRSKGYAVLALERALWRLGVRPKLAANPLFTKTVELELRAAQKRKHVAVDGVYGPETHRALAPHYDAFAIRQLNQVDTRTPAQRRLADYLAACMVLYNRRGVVHYSQGPSRMTIVRHRLMLAQLSTWGSIVEDCSSSLTGIRKVAGLSDPNRRNFNGEGFTGTMVVHGVAVSGQWAIPGDFAFYGHGWPYSHVTGCVGRDRWFSHGSESGPRITSLHYRGDFAVARRYDGLPT